MKGSDLLLLGALGLGAYLIYKQMNKSGFTETGGGTQGNNTSKDVVSTTTTGDKEPSNSPNPTYTENPKGTVSVNVKTPVRTSKAYQDTMTKNYVDTKTSGVIITKVTNSMPMTDSVKKALIGTVSPMTGLLRTA